jgi:topoisomerase-4 subunit A
MAKKKQDDTSPQDENKPLSADGYQGLSESRSIQSLYEHWFLEYASYVILERAVPGITDGLKPVQRRILHSMWEMEDGRYNKVANIIGNTMKYHPHGDASIGDALVQMGQKDILIDTQGNWGDPITGDNAAAPRYIEARLSKLALEIVFNPKTTHWGVSYDGRNPEPQYLPVKFPLLLAQGAEGIAVGLSTKVLPHNFIELCDAAIQVLKGKTPEIYPDFITGGYADFSAYQQGARGGKVRVRAKIRELDKKTLVITEIPFGSTTTSLIDSIVTANEKGKIKIRKVEDNTSSQVEIVVHLAPGISPDITMDALYAFTQCELSISVNACIIIEDKPHFITVQEILRITSFQTKALLQRELEIELSELQEKWHFSSLEKIFIREEMYIDFKKYDNRDTLYVYLYKAFEPFKKKLLRAITDEDLHKLTQIPMIRITRFDSAKADAHLKDLDVKIEHVKQNLSTITEYTIAYFKNLKTKFGAGRERKTEIRTFDTIKASTVAIANEKLYVNRAEGFVGTGLKKDEFVGDCSDLDEIIIFRNDGKCLVTKVADKTFVGKDILHVAVFRKNDERMVYHLIYSDGPKGAIYAKRFNVLGVTRDKEYDLTKGTKGSKVLYFTANPNGESETVTINLKVLPRMKKPQFDYDLGELTIQGRGSGGKQVCKYEVKKITLKSKGVSTLSGRKIWFDDILKRLNTDGRGKYLGSFSGEDLILAVYGSGSYELTNFDLSNHYDDDLRVIRKYKDDIVLSAVHLDGAQKIHFVKRFVPEQVSIGKKVSFISEAPGSKLIVVASGETPAITVKFAKDKKTVPPPIDVFLHEFIDVKGMKAQGNKLSPLKVSEVLLQAGAEPELTEADDPLPSVETAKVTFEVEDKRDGADGNVLKLF